MADYGFMCGPAGAVIQEGLPTPDACGVRGYSNGAPLGPLLDSYHSLASSIAIALKYSPTTSS